jgi:hypothetical protein
VLLTVGRALLIGAVNIFFLFWLLPVIAREVDYGRDVFYALGCSLIGAGSGYVFVRRSTSEECWQHATVLGGLIYFAIVLMVSAQARAIVLPVPIMFVLSGFSIGGLIRWNQLPKETRSESAPSTDESDTAMEIG